jgi:hypothetical protein
MNWVLSFRGLLHCNFIINIVLVGRCWGYQAYVLLVLCAEDRLVAVIGEFHELVHRFFVVLAELDLAFGFDDMDLYFGVVGIGLRDLVQSVVTLEQLLIETNLKIIKMEGRNF